MKFALARVVELATDLIIVVATATLLVRWAAQPSRVSSAVTTPADLRVAAGGILTLDGIEWTAAERTVLLAVRTTCPACNSSVEFYRRLFEACAASHGCDGRVVSPEDVSVVREWLRTNGIEARHVTTLAKDAARGFYQAPTLVMIDRCGVITDLANGVLSAADEERFLARIRRLADASPVVTDPRVAIVKADRDLAGLMRRPGVLVIDVRERDECNLDRGGTHCLPLKELGVRAPIELKRDSAIVVDCSIISSADCRDATRLLFISGFHDVSVAVAPN